MKEKQGAALQLFMAEQSVSNVASSVYGGTAFVNNFYYPSLHPTDSPAVIHWSQMM